MNIIDIRDIAYKINSYDVCIVGSGVGGGVLAISLARLGKKVLCVEVGNLRSHKENRIRSIGRGLGLQETFRLQVGGTSNLWHGVVGRYEFQDWRKGWPICWKEIQSHYEEALRFHGIGDEWSSAYNESSFWNGLRNMDRELLGEFNLRCVAVSEKPLRLREMLLKERHLLIDLMTGASVEKLVPASGDNKAVGLQINIDGRIEHLFPKKVVLSAGALSSPVILQKSCDEIFNSIEGRESIGKFLADHPMGFFGTIEFKRRVSRSKFFDAYKINGARLRLGISSEGMQCELNHNLYLKPSVYGGGAHRVNATIMSLLRIGGIKDIRLTDIINVLKAPRVLLTILVSKFLLPFGYKYADLFFVMEQKALKESYVKWNEQDNCVEINWTVSVDDEKDMKNFISTTIDKLRRLDGVKQVVVPDSRSWTSLYTSAAHHLGTLKMGIEKEAVVDAHLKVKGLSNLWVCDASVLPSVGNINPSLTLTALSIRLSKRLSGDD